MTVKYATDVIETFDTEKTLGTLNFLETILHKKWEDYVDEATGEEKRRETDLVEEVDVKLYSSAVRSTRPKTMIASYSMTSRMRVNASIF